MKVASRSRLSAWSWLLVLAVVWFGLMPDSHAVLMRNGVASSEYEQHAQTYQGSALWVSTEYKGKRYTRGSGVRLNEWYGLTAAHLFDQGGDHYTNAIVGTGSDRWFDRGVVRKITEILIRRRARPAAAALPGVRPVRSA